MIRKVLTVLSLKVKEHSSWNPRVEGWRPKWLYPYWYNEKFNVGMSWFNVCNKNILPVLMVTKLFGSVFLTLLFLKEIKMAQDLQKFRLENELWFLKVKFGERSKLQSSRKIVKKICNNSPSFADFLHSSISSNSIVYVCDYEWVSLQVVRRIMTYNSTIKHKTTK